MTKSYFIRLADYNIWANNVVRSWYDRISDEQSQKTVISSFTSLSETALHVASAESIWLDRLKNVPSPVWLAADFKGTKNDILNTWLAASGNLRAFLEDFDENKLPTSLFFKRLNGDPYEMLHHEVLAHIFNHSSYHRGQIVTMMRQIGFTDVESTDMLLYFRKYK